jgi:hypothetical protein
VVSSSTCYNWKLKPLSTWPLVQCICAGKVAHCRLLHISYLALLALLFFGVQCICAGKVAHCRLLQNNLACFTGVFVLGAP